MELEETSRRPLMLKEWLELESSAELSRDGFGCYPRQLAAELRSASGRRRNGYVIAKVSAVVRAALFRAPVQEGEAAALSRSLSRRLRVGFWKKRKGDAEDMDMRVASCSATASSPRRGCSSPVMSPRRVSWEGHLAGGDGADLGGRRSHETEVAGRECETTCGLDEEREQEPRLSPVSVMDYDDGGGNGHSEDDEITSPFERSLGNVRRASQQLLQKIRQFEQLAELDTSDVDNATSTAEDTSYGVEELDSAEDDKDAEGGSMQDLVSLPGASSSCGAPCFKKLLEDFFREGLLSFHGERSDDPDVQKSLLEIAKAWLDGRPCGLRSDGKAGVEEIEPLGQWRRFIGDEQELLAFDVEGDIFWSLMEESVDDMCQLLEDLR
ncbi:uncharacterized protein LOC133887750 [Phragmites australis]|uniref:uncharacterized protein LOC133887750 n=1 Tax=Phragmites australis TaxID=29695 RepID=UPI002D7690E1|nr:uncharacterized protein LOC133887750 [Phragmites australis]